MLQSTKKRKKMETSPHAHDVSINSSEVTDKRVIDKICRQFAHLEKIVGSLNNPKSDLVTIKCELKSLATRLQKQDLKTWLEETTKGTTQGEAEYQTLAKENQKLRK